MASVAAFVKTPALPPNPVDWGMDLCINTINTEVHDWGWVNWGHSSVAIKSRQSDLKLATQNGKNDKYS